MKKIVSLFILAAFVFVATEGFAGPKWPDKGWHKGPYLTGNVGMMQATNDRHSVTTRKFDGSINPSFGLTFGWDIADWIGPMLQMSFSTAKSQVGDPNNNAAAQTYQGFVFPAGTFPTQNAREYAVNLGLYARATLPYFTTASWQGNNLKFIPYLKLGGVGHALYVNASTANNKVGAYGGGLGIGAGAELFIWKGIFFAVDFTEHIIFQQEYKKNITDNAGVARNLKIIEGGTKFQANLLGLIGWHF